MNCGFISKDVVTVTQKALYTHCQVSRENVLIEFYEQSVNFEYLYLSYFYTSYVIVTDRQGEALE